MPATECTARRRRLCAIATAGLLVVSSVEGFAPISRPAATNTLQLLMGLGPPLGKNKNENNKPKTTNKKGNPLKPKKTRSKNDKRNEDYDPKKSARQQQARAAKPNIQLPSQNSRAPPWQVLSPKDAKENVQAEKRRRELIKLGTPLEELAPVRKTLARNMLSDAERSVLAWKRFQPASASGMTFVGSYLDHRLPPRLGVPEVAFLGRSNVGKSSLLNRLVPSGSDEARVGKTPGATASVNLYTLMERTMKGTQKALLGLADLPGFGYAKLSKEIQQSVQEAAERYLSKREELALGILLVDSRRVPSDDDRAILAALYDIGVPIVVVATKIDKLSKNEVEKSMETIREELGLPEGQPLQISSVTGEGTKALWTIILEACETRVGELRVKLERNNEMAEDVGGLELDEDGNIMPFDDGEELAYDQGYDWIHSNSDKVYYDGDVGDFVPKMEQFESFEEGEIGEPYVSTADLGMKALKRMAKRMERDGEV